MRAHAWCVWEWVYMGKERERKCECVFECEVCVLKSKGDKREKERERGRYYICVFVCVWGIVTQGVCVRVCVVISETFYICSVFREGRAQSIYEKWDSKDGQVIIQVREKEGERKRKMFFELYMLRYFIEGVYGLVEFWIHPITVKILTLWFFSY